MKVLRKKHLNSKWMDTDSKGILSMVTSKDHVAGGHEVLCYGYNKTHFMIMNSWSTNWGLKGFCLMQKNAFDGLFQSEGGYDAHYVKLNWGNVPTPPEPTPIDKSIQVGDTITARIIATMRT